MFQLEFCISAVIKEEIGIKDSCSKGVESVVYNYNCLGQGQMLELFQFFYYSLELSQ